MCIVIGVYIILVLGLANCFRLHRNTMFCLFVSMCLFIRWVYNIFFSTKIDFCLIIQYMLTTWIVWTDYLKHYTKFYS